MRLTAARTARRFLGTALGVGAGLLGGGASVPVAAGGALVLASLWPIHWLASLPPRPGEPDPAAIQWSAGAAGERRTARLLRPLGRRGWVALHDRRIPGSSANIDHLVVGPNGVQVIDSKAWHAPVHLSDGTLWCGAQPVDLTTTAWEAVCVELALQPALWLSGCVRVEAVLCVHGPAIHRPGYRFEVKRAAIGSDRPGEIIVHVIAARDLRRHVQRCGSGIVLPSEVGSLAAVAARALPAA